MSFNRYYQEELTYLRDLGAEFARRNPDLAQFLGRDSFDPDVERLLEGFAFLTGRLREKLDDELPELSHSLADMIWPQMLMPVPAMTVMQFHPIGAAGVSRQVVARNSEVASRSIYGRRCRFRTSYDVELLPMRVSRASAERFDDVGMLKVEFLLDQDVTFAKLGLVRVRLHFPAGRSGTLGRALFFALCATCRAVHIEDADGNGFILSARDAIVPAGHSPRESILADTGQTLPAFRLLQEYFTFEEKFLFVDIRGLGPTAGFSGRRLNLVFHLTEPFAETSRLEPECIRLNATPAINLFDAPADPITVAHRKSEYLLSARDGTGHRHTIHSVRRVAEDGPEGASELRPLHSLDALGQVESQTFYTLHRHINPVSSELETRIAFSTGVERNSLNRSRVVAVEANCTDGNLPRYIPMGHIDQLTDRSPSFASFNDIRPVQPQIPPPLQAGLMRNVLANLLQNARSMLSVSALRMLMTTCNPRIHVDNLARQEHFRRLRGVSDLVVSPLDWVLRGVPVRGSEITLGVIESKFGSIADAYLFGSILTSFLDDIAELNSVHRLTVHVREDNRQFRWPVRSGQRRTV